MSVSVRRHNLQRLRAELNVSQATLAAWVGRSAVTIKAVEIGKLTLSDNLATLIAEVTGADKDWLLRNDLSEPMPALVRKSAKLSPDEEAYGCTFALLHHLFDRMFAAAARMKPSEARKNLAIFIEITAKQLIEAGQPNISRKLSNCPMRNMALPVASARSNFSRRTRKSSIQI
jgi:DNA-binding XRE family transcriptional regulator